MMSRALSNVVLNRHAFGWTLSLHAGGSLVLHASWIRSMKSADNAMGMWIGLLIVSHPSGRPM